MSTGLWAVCRACCRAQWCQGNLSFAIQNLDEASLISAAPLLTHTHNSQHTCIHTPYILHTDHTCTYTLHTQPLNGTLAAHSSFFLSRLGPRSPTCHSPRPSTKPRPRTSWCTRSCCGGPWTTSPAEVRETWPGQGENGRGDFTPCGYRRF